MDPKLLNSRKAECFTAQELMLNQAQESKVKLTAAQDRAKISVEAPKESALTKFLARHTPSAPKLQ